MRSSQPTISQQSNHDSFGTAQSCTFRVFLVDTHSVIRHRGTPSSAWSPQSHGILTGRAGDVTVFKYCRTRLYQHTAQPLRFNPLCQLLPQQQSTHQEPAQRERSSILLGARFLREKIALSEARAVCTTGVVFNTPRDITVA